MFIVSTGVSLGRPDLWIGTPARAGERQLRLPRHDGSQRQLLLYSYVQVWRGRGRRLDDFV